MGQVHGEAEAERQCVSSSGLGRERLSQSSSMNGAFELGHRQQRATDREHVLGQNYTSIVNSYPTC